MSGKTALLIGATGNTGSYLLRELLSSPNFTKVGEFGRRVTPLDSLPASGKEKLEQHKIDFEKLDEAGLQEGKWDVVFVTLGTTRALAGSAENFLKIDQEYVVNAARHALDPSKQQRLVYVSSGGANARSSFLYMRSKGQTELALSKLGYGETIIFRPGFLQGASRPEGRAVNSALEVITAGIGTFWDGVGIHIRDLAKAVRVAGAVGTAGLLQEAGATKTEGGFTLIGNHGALVLSKSDL